MLTPDFDKLDAHHEVIVEEPSGICLVGSYSANPCREMNDSIRFSLGIEPAYRLHLYEVVVLTAGHHKVGAATYLKLFDNEGSKKSRSTCDDDAFIGPI